MGRVVVLRMLLDDRVKPLSHHLLISSIESVAIDTATPGSGDIGMALFEAIEPRVADGSVVCRTPAGEPDASTPKLFRHFHRQRRCQRVSGLDLSGSALL